jgi:hypothetical protein
MKSLVKIAVCSLFAVALGNAAHGQELAPNLGKALADGPAARAFVKEALGLNVTSSTTSKEIGDAIATSIGKSQQGALIKLLNSYAKGAVAADNSPALQAKNNAVFNTAFATTTAQVKAMASNVSSATTRSAAPTATIVPGTQGAPSCSTLNVAHVAAVSGIAEPVVQSLAERGKLSVGDCTQSFNGLNDTATKNGALIALHEDQCDRGGPATKDCLVQAVSADLGLSPEEALPVATQLATECKYVRGI